MLFRSDWAAPIATLMIEKYLRDSISRPELEKRMFEGVVQPKIYLEEKMKEEKKKQEKKDSLSTKVVAISRKTEH